MNTDLIKYRIWVVSWQLEKLCKHPSRVSVLTFKETAFWDSTFLGNFPAIQSLFRNATSCTEAEDGHFEHFFKFSQGHRLETMLQKAHVHKLLFFFLYRSVGSLSTGLVIHISCSLYSIPYKCRKVNAGQTSHLLETMVKKNHCHIWLHQPNKHASGKQHCLWGLRPSVMLHTIDSSWLPLFWDQYAIPRQWYLTTNQHWKTPKNRKDLIYILLAAWKHTYNTGIGHNILLNNTSASARKSTQMD